MQLGRKHPCFGAARLCGRSSAIVIVAATLADIASAQEWQLEWRSGLALRVRSKRAYPAARGAR